MSTGWLGAVYHYACGYLWSVLVQGSGKAKGAKNVEAGKGAGQIEALWQTVVEAGMLSSSHERKYLGMQLFRRMLPALRHATLSLLKQSPNP